MKNIFTRLILSAAIAVTALTTACTEDFTSFGKPTISDINATDRAVTFNVKALGATKFGYVCTVKGEAITPEQVMADGTVVEAAEGQGTCKGLKPDTDYTITVVATDGTTLSEPTAADFKTAVATQTITFSNITPSYNSVTFDITAAEATVIAYACVAKGEEKESSWVFDNGTVVGKTEGTFTCKGLTADTEYSLLAVSSGSNGLSSVYSSDFRTLVDSGTASDEFGAGIRITKIETNNVYLDITNGSAIDHSLVSVWGKATLENSLMESMKGGLTRDEAIKGLISELGYMAFQVLGQGVEVSGLDYQTQQSAALFPDHHYVVLSIGCVGDEMKSVNEVDFKTEGFKLIGDPAVEITSTTSYISFKHHFTPNADADYYFYFGTLTEQVDEFINYFETTYSAEYGAGIGERMLKEFIRDYDIFYMNNTDESDFSYTVGFDQQDVMFSICAFGADKNLMMGSKLSRDDVHTLPIPQSDPAQFSIEVDRVATTSARFKLSFGANCYRIYLTPFAAGTFDPATTDQTTLARQLWDGAWAVTRPTDDSYPKGTEYYTEIIYYADLAPGTSYELVATGLNYEAGLSPIFCTEPFTMKNYSFEGSEAVGEVSLVSAAREKAKVNYKFEESCVMLYHRLVQRNDLYKDLTDQDILNHLVNGNPDDALGGEMWAANDPAEDNPLDWNWTWTALTPNTTYDYYYTIEDVEGRLTPLRKFEITTQSINPGANPDVTMNIGKITAKEVYMDIIPNEDCGMYYYCVHNASEFEKTEQTKEELETAIHDFVASNGLSAVDAFYDARFELVETNADYYAMAIGLGADNVFGPLRYQKFRATDGEQPDYVGQSPASVAIWRTSAIGNGLRSGSGKDASAVKAANRRKADEMNRGINPTMVEKVTLPEVPSDAEIRIIDFKQAAAQLRAGRRK